MNDARAPASSRPVSARMILSPWAFGPPGILAVLVIVASSLVFSPLGAVLVLLWARRSRTPWREIGYVRPGSWIGSLAVGIGIGVVLKLLLKSIVMPLLGAEPINQAYHYLAGNRVAAALLIVQVTVYAGFAEETIYRGYLFERFGKLLGQGVGAKVVTVLATSSILGSLHYFEQGFSGVQNAIIAGLVFGTVFALTGRIWMVMCAHVAFDVVAIALIYWNLEAEFAHLIFQ